MRLLEPTGLMILREIESTREKSISALLRTRLQDKKVQEEVKIGLQCV